MDNKFDEEEKGRIKKLSLAAVMNLTISAMIFSLNPLLSIPIAIVLAFKMIASAIKLKNENLRRVFILIAILDLFVLIQAYID